MEELTVKIVRQITVTILVDGKEIWISFRVGIDVFPQDGDQAEILMRNAEAALSHAKRTKVMQRVYDLDMDTRTGEKMLLENR